MTRVLTVAFCLALGANSATASAETGIADDVDINNGLLIIAAADKIRRSCDTINGRLFRAQKFATNLKTMAREKGYSTEEVDAYLNSKAERAKVRERRNEFFASQGASNLDPASLCTLGYAEIARNSQIGYLLKAK